jgi:hypothetical protein
MAELSLKEEIAQTVYRKFMVLFCGDEEILKEIKIDSMFVMMIRQAVLDSTKLCKQSSLYWRESK